MSWEWWLGGFVAILPILGWLAYRFPAFVDFLCYLMEAVVEVIDEFEWDDD